MNETIQAIRGHFEAHPARLIPVAIAATLITLSLTKRWQPPALRRVTETIQHGAEWLVRRLAAVITAIVLTFGYVVAISPIALYWKIARKDPLRRRFPGAGTLWSTHEGSPIDPAQRARRQF